MKTLKNGLIVKGNQYLGYVFNFQDKGAFHPDGNAGKLNQDQIDKHNAALTEIELEQMKKSGRGVFYLFHKQQSDGQEKYMSYFVGTWASKDNERVRVTSIKKSKNNWGAQRTDVWFRFDGSNWYGRNCGDNDIVRCKRLKE